ncbi:NYN domain-containing protein [Candidatus Daviesbacteria bacterium]|nr:NYN domain-containing protein [Candidatus Daviesbacteria bacterium]
MQLTKDKIKHVAKNEFSLNLKGKTAVFIDAANIELSAKDLRFRVDYQKLYHWLKSEVQLSSIGFYSVRFDTKEHDGFLTFLKRTGYKLVTKPLKLIKNRKEGGHLRKANFDVEIAVDVTKRLDTFNNCILFSGDSDFHYLIRELKRNGKIVVVASLKYHVAKELVESADFYLDLRKIRSRIQRSERKP